MTKCSRWLPGHDQAAAARAPVPEPTELKDDIETLEAGSRRSESGAKLLFVRLSTSAFAFASPPSFRKSNSPPKPNSAPSALSSRRFPSAATQLFPCLAS